jgi:phage shock protein PspC (stress-responsive transcriptional regulator)
MDKTVKINLNGNLFQAEEDAYILLRDYLKAIDARFGNMKGSNETIDDIEARIAEIFTNKRGVTGVILKEDVEEVISILGKPEDFDINEPPVSESGSYTNRRTLYRNPADQVIGGVCGGMAAYLDVQTVWVRLAFLLFALAWGLGFFIYIGLWIALPKADNETRKRELFGKNYDRSRVYGNSKYAGTADAENSSGKIASALNQVLMAIGKVIYVFVRVILVIIGVSFAISGAALLMTAILMFFFKAPGFMPGTFEGNFFFLPDFLEFIVSPEMAPWIIILGFVAFLLPILALIYWGTKMIFWFRAKDGIFSLGALVIWVMSITALSLLLANQGLSFSENGRTSETIASGMKTDTLYIVTKNRVKDLKYDRAFDIPDETYAMYMNSTSGELYIQASLDIKTGTERTREVEVEKRSSARSRSDASDKAEAIPYNTFFSGDTLYIDEYFTIGKERKWSGDFVNTVITVPENTIIKFDSSCERMLGDQMRVNDNWIDEPDPWELGGKYWRVTEDSLTEVK